MQARTIKLLQSSFVILLAMIQATNHQQLLAAQEVELGEPIPFDSNQENSEADIVENLNQEQENILSAIRDPDRLAAVSETGQLRLDANNLSIVPKSCTGRCYVVDMNFPHDAYFTSSYESWKTSHGTPTVSPNSAWMWSANRIGEGLNLNANFIKGRDYCTEFLLTLSRYAQNAPAYSAANIDLTNGSIIGSTTTLGTPIPPLTYPNQGLLQEPYAGHSMSHTENYIRNFRANNNFNNIWFHPYSPSEQVNMQILKVKICEQNDPCDFRIRLFKSHICSFLRFYVIFDFQGNALNVVGYHWNFGDGNTSNEAYPSHFYSSSGTYSVTLKVIVENSRGECCTKTYVFSVMNRTCDPCGTLNHASIRTTNYGSLIKFEPTVPSSFGIMFYQWTFFDGTYSTNREVWKSYLPASVSLRIYYSGTSTAEPCCSVTLNRRFYFNAYGNQVSAYPLRNIAVYDNDSDQQAEMKLAEVAAQDGIELGELEETDLNEV